MFPLRSKSADRGSPGQYQSRSCHPMAVGSNPGSSAAHGSPASTGSTASSSTYPTPSSTDTATAPTASNARRTSPAFHPVHHFRSASAAGPHAASHRRTNSA